jgi:segregation and condensation protein B
LPEPSEQEKLKHDLALVEAALYVAGRPLDLKTLASIVGTRSKRRVEKIVRELVMEYGKRNTALEVKELENERFVLQLKAEYTPKVRKLAIRPLLGTGPLKTLSYIAYRQPVLQKQVIDVRGPHAYDHIEQLESQELITREKVGRTKMLRTTDFFADYFGLSRNPQIMKRQLRSIFEELSKPKPQKIT